MTTENIAVDEAQIEGEITSLIFQSEEDGFCIIKVLDRHNKTTTITGYCAHPQTGQIISARGQWTETKQYGKQFKANSITVQPPKSKEAILQYLTSGAIRGIGKQLAKQLIDLFGKNILDILSEQPERIMQLPGIGKKKLATICDSWKEQQGFASTSIFLQNHGIGPARAVKIYKRYGNDTVSIIESNPYRLYREIQGIGFHIADKIAQSLGMPSEHIERITNGIIFTLQENTSHGHTAISEENLYKEAAHLLQVNTETIANGVEKILSDKHITEIKETSKVLYALSDVYFAEQSVAKKIHSLCKHPSHLPSRKKLEPQLKQINEILGYELSVSQLQALKNIFNNKVCVMTGGPGVGKTTLVQSIVHLLQKNHSTFLLCAPTGRAAKRLKESTGHSAKTIHRALGVDPISRTFQNNEKNQLNIEYCIVDEASMLDVHLTKHLLAALPKHCGLLFVGDVDQLPSVGPGNVLNDIIKTNRIAIVELTEIFRQAKTSHIVQYAHKVRQGYLPQFHAVEQNQTLDSYVIFSDDAEDIMKKIEYMISERIPKKFKVDPLKDIQVLCPMQKGPLGTQIINQRIQKKLSQSTEVIKHFSSTYIVGDRVMQTKNNYEKDVFNGDIGYIQKHNPHNQSINILFDDKSIDYYYDELDEISLAYAMTIHKSQGSEFRVVILPIISAHYIMLERNLIYTGMTRAKELLIIIGNKKSLQIGVQKQTVKERSTLLSKQLNSQFIENM